LPSGGRRSQLRTAIGADLNHAIRVMTGHRRCAHLTGREVSTEHQERFHVRRQLHSEEIRATLERDQRVPHPAEVAITEQRGTVVLRGSVGSPHQRRAATRIARSIKVITAGVDGDRGMRSGRPAAKLSGRPRRLRRRRGAAL